MIVVMGTESMKQPRISSSTITQIRNRYLLSVMDSSATAAREAILSRVSTQENAPDAPTISMILPVLFIDVLKHFSSCLKSISL